VERAAGPGAAREEGRATATPRTPRRPTREADAAETSGHGPGRRGGAGGSGAGSGFLSAGERGCPAAATRHLGPAALPAVPPATRALARAHTRTLRVRSGSPARHTSLTGSRLSHASAHSSAPWGAARLRCGGSEPVLAARQTPVQQCLSPGWSEASRLSLLGTASGRRAARGADPREAAGSARRIVCGGAGHRARHRGTTNPPADAVLAGAWTSGGIVSRLDTQ